MFNPVTDFLTLEEACQYLKLPPFRIAMAIAYNELRCGVIARNWRGNVVPSRKDIPRGDSNLKSLRASRGGSIPRDLNA